MNKLFLCLLLITTAGCNNNMDELNSHINNLVTNTDNAVEQSLVTKIQSFASSQKTSYGIEVSDNGLAVPMAELDKHIKMPLVVTITAGDSENKWKPLDNQNIYILLRE